jgi:hypothetical protein
MGPADDCRSRPPRSPERLAGASVMAFGALTLFSTVAAGIVAGGFSIDLLGLVLLAVGYQVRRQSRTAAIWAAVLMGWYGLVAACFLLSVLTGVPPVRYSGKPWQFPLWSAAVFAAIVAWCGLTVAALVRTARQLRGREREREGRCPACGYDLTANASGICPECGTPHPQQAATAG